VSDLPVALAPLRLASPVERIGGGYETDVFQSGDGLLAIKLKHGSGSTTMMHTRAAYLAHVAAIFQSYLGAQHSLPSFYLVAADDQGQRRIISVQPLLKYAHVLHDLDIMALPAPMRKNITNQLVEIATRALHCYAATGYLPDLYGVSTGDSAQARRSALPWIIRELWRLLTDQPLLKANNLLLTADQRLVLVDYDPLSHPWLNSRLLNWARALLLKRDRRLLMLGFM
jgi:hypothetical protein